MGAEGRIADYQLLALMEREWRRPLSADSDISWMTSTTSERAALVLLFWTYYETRIERIVRIGLRKLPERVGSDLLRRYDSVTRQATTLYQVLFGTTYHEDLRAVGAEPVGGHLASVRDARNRFMHGDPMAITDQLLTDVVSLLKEEHDAWISVFNRRIKKANADARE